MEVTKMFYIITADGHWGRADNLVDAARNASVTYKGVEGLVYATTSATHKNVVVTDYGSIRWEWLDGFYNKVGADVHKAGELMTRIGHFELKLTKAGKLTMSPLAE